MDDKRTIIKVIASYKIILESEQTRSKKDLLDSLFLFINYQLEVTTDDEVFEKLFDLVHDYLQVQPAKAGELFQNAFLLFKTGNSNIKQESLNVIGHIFQIDAEPTFVEDLYQEIENTYSTPDDKLKRLILDALSYFVSNFPAYSHRIKNFLFERLEHETFGIATTIFSIFGEIYEQQVDSSIEDLAESTLLSLDSPAKLGAINFLKNNMPTDQSRKETFEKLFLKNLEDIDNAIGVRSNIFYAINELIRKKVMEKDILAALKKYSNDGDPDVKSALIQTFTDQYLIGNSTLIELEELFDKGMYERDYIVRLVVIQAIKRLEQLEPGISQNFSRILARAREDDSQKVQETAMELLK